MQGVSAPVRRGRPRKRASPGGNGPPSAGRTGPAWCVPRRTMWWKLRGAVRWSVRPGRSPGEGAASLGSRSRGRWPVAVWTHRAVAAWRISLWVSSPSEVGVVRVPLWRFASPLLLHERLCVPPLGGDTQVDISVGDAGFGLGDIVVRKWVPPLVVTVWPFVDLLRLPLTIAFSVRREVGALLFPDSSGLCKSSKPGVTQPCRKFALARL